jgi:6-carboxyhexanoate--CoA ligase
MTTDFYSIRLRAEGHGRHLCGAERIAPAGDLPVLAAALVARAMAHAGGQPDVAHCTIAWLGEIPAALPLPAVTTWEVPAAAVGRSAARALLQRAGVAAVAAETALRLLAIGPAPGGEVMRGAMLVDAATGDRLEPDPARGVRISRMDLAPAARAELLAALADASLGHPRTAEALVLAGKVLRAPGVLAELCWSDDPAYLAGYVADPCHGYQRITRLKEPGDPMGGRALFIATGNWDRAACVAFLERQPVLFDRLGMLHPPQIWQE